MIWGNTHKTFFFFNLSQYSLAGKAPVLVPLSGSGTADIRSPGGPRGRLAGWWLEGAVAGEEATCCGLQRPFPGSSPSPLPLFRDRGRVKAEQASREIHLFQNKGTEITHQRNVLSAYSPWCGRLDKIPTGRAPSCSLAAGSGQGKGAPGILSHRGCDFGRRGQADAYVQPILT